MQTSHILQRQLQKYQSSVSPDQCGNSQVDLSPKDYFKYCTDKFSKLRLEHSLAEICRSSRAKMQSPQFKVSDMSEIRLRKKFLAEHERCQDQILNLKQNSPFRVSKIILPQERFFKETKLSQQKAISPQGKLIKKRQILLPSIVTYNIQEASDRFKYKKPRDVFISKSQVPERKTIKPIQKLMIPKKPERLQTLYESQTSARIKQDTVKEEEVQREPKRGSLQLDSSIFDQQLRLQNEVKEFLMRYKAKLR